MRGENKSHKIRLILGVLIGLSLVLIIFFSLYNRQNIKVSNKDKKTDVINETNNNQDNEMIIQHLKANRKLKQKIKLLNQKQSKKKNNHQVKFQK